MAKVFRIINALLDIFFGMMRYYAYIWHIIPLCLCYANGRTNVQTTEIPIFTT